MRIAASVALVLTGAVGAFVEDAVGLGLVRGHHDVRGLLVLPVGAVVAALLLARARATSDAVALALVVPLVAVVTELTPSSHVPAPAGRVFAVAAALGLTLGAVALALSLRRDADPARTRVMISMVPIALLAPLAWVTVAWSPESLYAGEQTLVTMPPQMYVAAVACVLALVDLERRRARGLAWIGVLGLALVSSPTWGEYSSGCMGFSGPLGLLAGRARMLLPLGASSLRVASLLLHPLALSTLSLVPWLAPAWRFLRAEPLARQGAPELPQNGRRSFSAPTAASASVGEARTPRSKSA